MCLIPLWVLEYTPKIPASLKLDHPMQPRYRGMASDILRKPLSMRTKPFIIVGKEHDLAPS